jgi:hypothetical protein
LPALKALIRIRVLSHKHVPAGFHVVDRNLASALALAVRLHQRLRVGRAAPAKTAAVPALAVRAWPAGLPEQIKAVAEVVAQAGKPLDMPMSAADFQARGRWRDRLPMLLDTLVALGRLRQAEDARRVDAGR